MAKRRIKTQEHERLDEANLKRVISLLEDEKSPITKKEACRLLNITYNTSRLNRILEDFKTKEEYAKKRRESNRGKPFTEREIKEIILEYLKGTSKSQISKFTYRSTASIDNILERYSIPRHTSSKKSSYKHPAMIPDEAISEEFEPGELVWAARYNCVAEVIKLIQEHPEHGKVYNLWIFGKHNERGNQPWYELGKMPILKELGITKSDVSITDKLQMEYRIG